MRAYTALLLLHLPALVHTLTLVHLTDVHVDPYYLQGSLPSCYCETHETCPRFPASCGMAPPGAPAAGPFGDSQADCATSPALWASAMAFLAATPATQGAPIAFFTGDFGSAGLGAPCSASKTAQEQILEVVTRDMAAARAALPSARVFGVYGNHEGVPGDVFGSESEMAWLYGPLAMGALGADLAGDAAALATLNATGWYTTPLTPSTSLIALNTNYWGSFNPAHTSNTSAAALLGEAQFQWLGATLQALSAANRSALVIGHIPPGSGTWLPGAYSRYRALLTLHHPVVLAEFFGHDHKDQLTLVRSCSAPSTGVRAPRALPQPPPHEGSSQRSPLALQLDAAAAAEAAAPYAGPWVKTCGIEWCSGGNLAVGDVWGRGTEPGAPHCPLLPAANGTAEGRVALCEGVCGNLSACAGFTHYPQDGSAFGACCFRTSTRDKPVDPASSACCYEKVAPPGPCEGAPQTPLHVLYSAPSLTEGYPPSNPGLRYYTLEEGSLAVSEVHTVWMNLSRANAEWAPQWDSEYNATQAYGLGSVGAEAWASALQQWAPSGADGWRSFVGFSQKQYEDTPECEGSCKSAWIGWMNGSAVDD
jgi:hypothetical protein